MRGTSATRFIVGALACAWLLGGLLGAAARDQDPDSELLDRATALRTFTQSVERYARLRAWYEEPLSPFDARRDLWSLRRQRAYLASAIRTARPEARLGDIFTEPVVRMLREDIGEAIHELDIEGLLDEDFDIALVDLVVTERVPRWAMRPVPEVLLERLPPLPGAIEYRLVGDALILWDVHAEVLIDALPRALVLP